MPIGTPARSSRSSSPGMAVPTVSPASDSATATSNPTVYAHWGLLGVIALFFIFVVLIQHQKIRDAIKPGNIAFNVWNLFVIFLSVVVSFTLFKVAAAKYAAANLPGGRFFMEIAGTV